MSTRSHRLGLNVVGQYELILSRILADPVGDRKLTSGHQPVDDPAQEPVQPGPGVNVPQGAPLP